MQISVFQVDPTYTGRVGANEAAVFLKKSGLSDIILGKVSWRNEAIFAVIICAFVSLQLRLSRRG